MKSIVLVALGLIALVAAQDLSQLPACATSCAASGIGSTGCAITDAHCVCSNVAFLNGVQSCIAIACDAADQLATLKFAQSYCASGGITISLPSAISNDTSAAPTSSPNSTQATSNGTTASQASATSTSSGAAAPLASGVSKFVVQAVGLGVAGIIAVL